MTIEVAARKLFWEELRLYAITGYPIVEDEKIVICLFFDPGVDVPETFEGFPTEKRMVGAPQILSWEYKRALVKRRKDLRERKKRSNDL